MITKIGFYIKIKVRSPKLRYKDIPLVIIILSIAIAALKIGDILIYSSVPFILYMVCRPISRFTVYKALFALITVLTVGGLVLSVKEVVLSVNIK